MELAITLLMMETGIIFVWLLWSGRKTRRAKERRIARQRRRIVAQDRFARRKKW